MLVRCVDFLTARRCLEIVGLSGAVGWAIGYAVFFAGVRGPIDDRGRVVGGDFINFYTAGRMILDGNGDRLFDLGLQQETQRRILQDAGRDRLAAYINPPVLAALYAPLAHLPYVIAFHLHSVLMLAAFFVAMATLRPHLPALHRWWPTVTTLALTFYPIARTIAGGQNTALSLVLLACLFSACVGQCRVRAGVFLGLLCYKPQLALPLAGLLMLRREWRLVGTAGVVALAMYAAGVVVSGSDWPTQMASTVARYQHLEAAANGFSQISWLGALEFALPAPLGTHLGYGFACATVFILIVAWQRTNLGSHEFPLLFGAAVAGTLLLSPHTQYYDAGLLVLPFLLTLHAGMRGGHGPRRGVRTALLFFFLFFPAFRVAKTLGFQPLTLLPLVLLLWPLVVERSAPVSFAPAPALPTESP